MNEFEFILAMVIRYDILFDCRVLLTAFTAKERQLDVALLQTKGLVDLMQQYKHTGFASEKTTASQLKHKRDENQKICDFPEKSYEYFLVGVDQALTALELVSIKIGWLDNSALLVM